MAQRVLVGDCSEHMGDMDYGVFDLVFADPPFNIGYKYDEYDDGKLTDREYLDWCYGWMAQAWSILKPTGSFWLAIGDAYAADLDVMARRQLGFKRQSWVIWHYSFGVNCTAKLTPSKTHLFHYSVSDTFTFNADAIKVPSMRQRKYNDSRAKAGGRLPNDVWVLDSKSAAEEGEAFCPHGDVWYCSRICGTFKERTGHPCQMPLPILERIVALSSNPGDTVLDPFLGSGTTLAACKNLGRNGIGIELSPEYAAAAAKRVGVTL